MSKRYSQQFLCIYEYVSIIVETRPNVFFYHFIEVQRAPYQNFIIILKELLQRYL